MNAKTPTKTPFERGNEVVKVGDATYTFREPTVKILRNALAHSKENSGTEDEMLIIISMICECSVSPKLTEADIDEMTILNFAELQKLFAEYVGEFKKKLQVS